MSYEEQLAKLDQDLIELTNLVAQMEELSEAIRKVQENK